MSDSDKLWFDWGIRGDVLQQLEKATAQATELQRALIAASKDMPFKEGFQNASRMEEVFDSLETTLKRISSLKPNIANKEELKSLEDLEKKVTETYGHFKTVREQLGKDPSKWTEKDLVKVLELSEGFKLLNTSVSRYLSSAEKAASVNSRFFDSMSNKALADLDRFNEQWERMNSASPQSERDRIVREAKEYQSLLDDREAQKIVDEINSLIEAKKFFEDESKKTLAELEAFNRQWEKMNSTASPFEKIVREAKQYEEELEMKAVKEVNEELEKREKLRKAADDIQEQQGKKILDNLTQQKQIERSMLDTESQRKIASLRNQNVEYSALTKKLQDIKSLMDEVKNEEKDLASGKISSPTLTRDVVSSRLEAIQRRYNELLAQGKERERQDAEAKEKKAASARKAAEAVQMLSHVNQGLISSYNRIAEAGSKANGITIQFQQQLANYTGLYGLERILKSIITIGGQFEVQHVALRNILGDVQEANVLFGQLQELAIESPKTFMELTAYAKQLSAYQIPASELYDTTKRLADMSAGLGVDMNRLILAYGQVRSAAVLRGQELRQFTEAGIPMVQALANKFTEMNGKLTTTADVFALISKRAVPFEMVKEVLWDMTNQGGQFYNMQAELADTLYGKWQKLQDQWQITLGNIASGASPAGAALKMLLELTVSLASAFDTFTPMLGMMGITRLGTSIFNSARNKLNEKNGNMAILRMEKAMEQEIARLERERVLYGRQLNAEEQALVNSKGKLRSQEYYLLGVEKQISTLKAYQLMQEGKLERAHFYKLLQMQGYTREQRKQIANGNILALQNQQSMLTRGWQGFKSFMGGWTGIVMTGIGAAMSAYSYIEQKREELSQKGDAMMSHAQQGANNLAKTLDSMEADGSAEKKIEVLEQALISLGSTGEAIVAKSREHMDDVNERLRVLKEGAEDYQKTLSELGNAEGKALFEKGIDRSDIEDYMKDYDDSINAMFKTRSLIERYSETYKKAIKSIIGDNEELKKSMEGLSLYEQIEKIGQKKLYDELYVNRKNIYGGLSAPAISALNAYFNKLVDVKNKWDDITTESIPKMADELKALARSRGIEDFDHLTPQQQQSLETLTREYVRAIQTGSTEAKNKLAEELASQVFHIKIVGDLTVDKTQLSSFSSYIWNRFGAGGALKDKGNVRIGNSVYTKAQVANIFKDIDTYDKETSQEILKLQGTKKKLEKLKGTASQVKDLEKDIQDKLAERRAVGLDDPKEKGGGSGSKKDAELDRWKARISILEKYRQELQQLEEYMSRSNAERKLRKDNNFNALFGYFTNPNDYKASLDEAIKALGRNGDRGKFVDELGAKQGAEDLRVFKEEVKNTVSELQRMMSVMSENYKTYQKWVELTGDTDLAARIAGVTQNTSYADWLTDEMNKAIAKTNYALTASDIFSLNEADAKVLGENNEIFKLWEEWQKNQQMLRKEQLDLYEEAYKGAQNYEDKIADVNRKLEKEIEAIEKLEQDEARRNILIGNARTNAEEKVSEIEWEKFKKESDWGRVFGDLDNMSLTTIKNMVESMKKFQKETKLSEKETRAWQKAMKDLTDKKITLDPVNSLTEAVKKYNEALMEVKAAKDNKASVDRLVNQIKGEVATNPQAAADKQKRLEDAVKKQTEASHKLGKAEDNAAEAFNALRKSAMAIANSIKDLGSSLSSLGSSVGGDIGNVLGGFGTIFSQLGNGISAIQNLDMNAKGFTGIFNKVSAVMTVVTSMIEMNKALASILPSTQSIYQKRAEEQRQINQLREAVDAYRVAVAKARAEESGWIGDNPLKNLQDAYKIHGEVAAEYYNKLYEAQEAYVESAAGIKKALVPIVTAITAIVAVAAGVFTAGTGTAAVGALGAAAIGALSAGTVAVTGITAAAIGASIAAGVGAAVGQAIQAGIDAISYDNGKVDARQNMKVQTRHSTFFRSEKTQNLEEWTKENLGMDLFDKSGLIDLKAAQAVLDSGATLVGETKQTLEKLMELKEQYDEWEKSVKDYISNTFGGLADDMTKAIWDWLDGGKDAMDSFKNYASDTFKQIAQDAVKTFLKVAVLDKFEEQLENLYKAYSMKDQHGNRIIDEQQLMLGVASIAGDMAVAFGQILPLAQQLGQTIANAFDQQGYDVISGSSDSASSSTGSTTLKSVTEGTADIIAGYINTIRADVSVNRITLAQILSVAQTQTEMPVIARAQLEQLKQIAINTGRNAGLVEEIRDLLSGNIKGTNYFRVK